MAKPTPKRLGEALFRALFTGPTRVLYAESRGFVSKSGEGLRLRLHFCLRPGDRWIPLLSCLPWELLYDPDTRDFLALSRRTPVVRSFEIPRPIPPLESAGTLHILVALANGPGEELDLQRERLLLEAACSQVPGIEVFDLDPPGIATLRKTLLGLPIHILHLMGHAAFDPVAQRGVLLFAEADGARKAVTGETLADILKDFPDLRLVFLNACNTARTPAGTEPDPFAGIASALVLGGVPAVLAMQLVVADDVAIAFSQAVYDRLALGDSLEAAVTEGRQAVHSLHPESAEWAIPVLFTRTSAGPFFHSRPVTLSPPANDDSQSPQPTGRRIGIPRGRRLGLALFVLALVALAFLARRILLSPLLSEPVRLEGFSIARYEVSQREFQRFVEANPQWRRDRIGSELHDGEYLGNWSSPSSYPSGLADHPVTRVSWHAALAYCRWVGGDLPTQAEWRRAAHAEKFLYPWGNVEISGPAPLNYCDRSCQGAARSVNAAAPQLNDLFPDTAPVNAFPAGRTREGVWNLSGNVWEWTLDVSGAERATMGGSFASTFEECSTDQPSWEPARLCASDGGFRCVWH